MPLLVLFLFGLLGAAGRVVVETPSPPGSWRLLLDDVACREAIERRLRRWGATDEVIRAPAGPRGTESYRIATGEIGVWITLRLPGDGSPPRLFRSAPERNERVDFAAREGACTGIETLLPDVRVSGGAVEFTDEDLAAALREADAVVVYSWSPHMPLSVEGYAEIAAAVRGAGVALVALLHPSADPDFAMRAARQHGIPDSALRKPASVELLFRDLAVHAPAVLVFASGRVSAVLPGYRSRKEYAEFLGRSLQPAR